MKRSRSTTSGKKLLLEDPRWYYATTLLERAELQRVRQNADSDRRLALHYFQEWRSQSPFALDNLFAQRLATDGITEDEFKGLLGIPVQEICDHLHGDATWLIKIIRAFSRSPPDSTGLPEFVSIQGVQTAGFLNLVEPLISDGYERLQEGIEALIKSRSIISFNPATVGPLLFAGLPNQLLSMLGRTLVLELNVARVNEALEGDTPRERFAYFLRTLREPDTALRILLEYPVLARQVVNCIENWLNFSLEFLDHLCVDWTEIKAEFSPNRDPGVLVSCRYGLGDRHRGGRSVVRASFSAGFEILYKPRPLAVELHFQELLEWLNMREGSPGHRTIKMLDRGGYGWVEFFFRKNCESQDEVRRFFERQGSYLALLHVLEATDIHHENLIALGEHPMLLDLETLFHPRFESSDVQSMSSTQFASREIDDSVLRIGLLPERIWANADSEGIDISGISAEAGQLSPDRFPQWADAETDTMRFTRERLAIPGSDNRPMLNGVEISPIEHHESVVNGFTGTYKILQENRDQLISGEGPFQRFARDDVRVIIRPTRIYSKMLLDSFHPDLLRDGLDRERFFDRLWVGVEDNLHLARTIQAECVDLHNADIPVFTTRPGSRDLWSSTTRLIPDFFNESGMDRVRRRLEGLSEYDLEKQCWFITASLTTLSTDSAHRPRSTRRTSKPEYAACSEDFLAAARLIGDRLETVALRDGKGISWIGLNARDQRYWSLTPLGADLYNGLPGVTLFLAYLGCVTRDDRYTELAQSTLLSLLQLVSRNEPQLDTIGAYTGYGGVIYTLCHLGKLWDRPDLLYAAEGIVELLPEIIERTEELDIVDGLAGCIACLLSFNAVAPSRATVTAAIQCGERLITSAAGTDDGRWLTNSSTLALSGFAHGAAGIAWALLKLFDLTGKERFRITAMDAIDYERSLFSSSAGNWIDLRHHNRSGQTDPKNSENFMTAWCHGAPGIGLARLSTLQILDDVDTRAEIEVALKTTCANGFGNNHSLCHGDLGNLDFVLQASRILENSELKVIVEQQADAILENIADQGYLCGVPLAVETPGLMTGLAGIGYGLLRVAEPVRVPSLLVLDPPLLKGT